MLGSTVSVLYTLSQNRQAENLLSTLEMDSLRPRGLTDLLKIVLLVSERVWIWTHVYLVPK